jgi:hypothetical protein
MQYNTVNYLLVNELINKLKIQRIIFKISYRYQKTPFKSYSNLGIMSPTMIIKNNANLSHLTSRNLALF